MRGTLHVRYVMHNNMLNQTQVLQHRCDTPNVPANPIIFLCLPDFLLSHLVHFIEGPNR